MWRMERHVPRGGGNSLKPSHNHGLWQVGMFNNLAPWGEKKFVSELKRTYKFQRGVNNRLDCHANQTRILSKEFSFVAGDYVRSTACNDVNCHTEDNCPKYRMVGDDVGLESPTYSCSGHPELNSGSTNVDKRLRNKCAMTDYGHAELVSVSCGLMNPSPAFQAPSPQVARGKIRSIGNMKENIFSNMVNSLFTTHHSLKRPAFTLAEGAAHVAHWNNSRKIAFTLAEVLITLGIIGVVAALTMPALIQQQHKLVVETRLKKFYSVINQAITMSERDNGDKLYWTPSDSDDLWNSYLKKYIKYVKEEDYYYARPRKVVYFADGSLVVIDVYYSTNADGSVKEKTTGGHFLFFPFAKDFKPTLSEEEFTNLYSKKLFSFGFWPNTDGPQWKQHYNKGVEPYKLRWDGDADKLKEKCYDGTELQWCTAVIQYNNWKIPKDYPFRL